MRSTLPLHQFAKPPFEPGACYVPAKDLLWGDNEHGYVTIPAARADAPETMSPLDFEKMTPPCDEMLAARLYRTGFLAMLLTDDGQPLLKNAWSSPGMDRNIPTEPDPDSAVEPSGAVCEKCGRRFKGKFIPHFHKMQCDRAA